MRGQDLCYHHGGNAAQNRRAATRRLARERVDGELADLLAELEVEAADSSPVELLLDATARCSAMTRVLGELVGRLPSLTDRDHLGDLDQHPVMVLYGQWTDRAARTAKLAVDAGVEQRMAAVSEAQVVMLDDVLRGVLLALGIDPAAPKVREIVHAQLALVPGPDGDV